MRKFILVVALFSGSYFSLAAHAQEFDCAALDRPPLSERFAPRERLNSAEQNGCLGGKLDDAPVAKEVAADLVTQGTVVAGGVSPEERRAATLAALDRVIHSLESARAAMPQDDGAGTGALYAKLHAAAVQARAEVAAQTRDEGLSRPLHWGFNRDTGEIGSADAPVRIGVQLHQGFLDDACRSPEAPACAQTYSAAKDLVRHARLVQRALSYHARPVIDAHYAEAVKRDRQWTAYFDEARFQYPWELWLNGLWITRNDPRPKDANGERMGFLPPPTSQWIVMHPDVGLEYVGGAADGNQFEPSVLLEVFGYNRWRWSDEGRMRGALGASLIAAYSDRASADDLAWGMMFHYHNAFSLGATYRDGDWGALISADVAQALGRVDEKRRKAMRLLAR